MKVFFTGTKGFLGSHLVSTLKDLVPGIFIHEFDGKIESYDSIESEFKTQNWDVIIHFAGLSHVADCENDPQKAFEVNTLGTIHLCQLMAKYNFAGHIYFTSTAQVFEAAQTESGVVYDENSPLKPQNIYAATKFYSESVLRDYATAYPGHVTVLRLFNHTHKSQSRKFLLPSVYGQIAEAKDGDSIKVGNLNLDRDFSLLSDFLSFASKLVLQKNTQKFAICCLSSGVPRNLLNVVKIMIKKSGKRLDIQVDPNLIRKVDPKVIVGKFKTSYSKILSDEDFVDAFLNES